MIKLTLKDGSILEVEDGSSCLDAAKKISEGLARNMASARLDGEIVDLRTIVEKDAKFEVVTLDEEDGMKTFWHTASHILAQAVKKVFPDAKCTIGPAIDNGFYYDFDMQSLTRADLDKIEEEMKKIVKEGDEITRFTLPRKEAIKFMEDRNEPYKVELIKDLPEDAEISFYTQGDFTDLCAGPHLKNTKEVKYFKLTSTSGAYWRGNSNNQMLTRIYGTAYTKKQELDDRLEFLENIKNRDHNKLGREMELFTTVDVIGQGLPLFMPKGTKIIQALQRWIEDLEDYKWGYVRTRTPLMAKASLYRISDHWYHYKDGMFILNDDENPDADVNEKGQEVMALRPMTCPFQYYVYKATQHSYRDLPYRMGETSTLFRNEDSGEMHGLTRVRQFTISEGHIVCAPEQIADEFKNCVKLMNYILTTLGLQNDVTYRMSKWDPNNTEKYLGTAEDWDRVQDAMREILDDIGLKYTEADGEAAFYGPKLDVQAKNVYGKEDTMITIQLDMFLSERFDMYYIDQNGEKKRPYIIHRTSLGCYERTLAWLIEKYAGALPTWLCPVQVKVIPVSDKFLDYAKEVEEKLFDKDIKVEIDDRSEKVGYKIREAVMQKTPYVIVVGEKDQADGTVTVRKRKSEDQVAMKLDEFTSQIKSEIQNKVCD